MKKGNSQVWLVDRLVVGISMREILQSRASTGGEADEIALTESEAARDGRLAGRWCARDLVQASTDRDKATRDVGTRMSVSQCHPSTLTPPLRRVTGMPQLGCGGLRLGLAVDQLSSMFNVDPSAQPAEAEVTS